MKVHSIMVSIVSDSPRFTVCALTGLHANCVPCAINNDADDVIWINRPDAFDLINGDYQA